MKTDKGDIYCEHVISASGNFARRTGTMVGLEVPVIPVKPMPTTSSVAKLFLQPFFCQAITARRGERADAAVVAGKFGELCPALQVVTGLSLT